MMCNRHELGKRVIALSNRLGPADRIETTCTYCGRREVIVSPHGVQIITASAPTTVAAWLRDGLESTKFLSARAIRLDHLVDFLMANRGKLRVGILKTDWEDTHEIQD